MAGSAPGMGGCKASPWSHRHARSVCAFAKADMEELSGTAEMTLPSGAREWGWREGTRLLWLPSGVGRKVLECLVLPKGNQSPRVPAAPEEAAVGSRRQRARRHPDCSAFEGLYLISLLHNNITCVLPLLIHLCLP